MTSSFLALKSLGKFHGVTTIFLMIQDNCQNLGIVKSLPEKI